MPKAPAVKGTTVKPTKAPQREEESYTADTHATLLCGHPTQVSYFFRSFNALIDVSNIFKT